MASPPPLGRLVIGLVVGDASLAIDVAISMAKDTAPTLMSAVHWPKTRQPPIIEDTILLTGVGGSVTEYTISMVIVDSPVASVVEATTLTIGF